MLLGLIDLNMLGAAQLPANSTIHYSLEGGRVPDPSPSASQLLKSWGARELLGYFQKRNTENYSIHCPRDPCTPREGLTWNTPTCSPHPRRSSAGASFQMNRSTSPSKTYQLKKVHPTTNPPINPNAVPGHCLALVLAPTFHDRLRPVLSPITYRACETSQVTGIISTDSE